ncbi:transcription initiation factor tfiid subunit [Anaeramoeba flamelloides]|uniref:Transcription initiation factor tfiid subunit n=1 Tax=Anaeramoeba flamelloides TaxID=1746091 RepID=A0AAV7ZGW1_9EUKA|nr:transcription initiation factor tfiid subunit [Anaeramoeba flamelloides]
MGTKVSSFKTLLKIPKKNSKKFYNLIENSNLAIVILDSNFVINFRNDRYYSLLKLDRSPLILNKTPHEISKSKKTIYAPYQSFYDMKTIKVLNKVFKEIDQSNTCEVIFTYKILKPEVHYIHTRVTMRNIKIGNKLSTMCSIVRLVENPLYLIKDHYKGNGDQNLIKSKKKKKKKKKKSKHRNNKSVIVIAKKKIENEKENKKEKEKEIRKKKGKENEKENEKEKESEMFTKREKEREKEKNNKFLFSDVSYSNLDVYSESLSTEFGASTVEEF